MSSDSHSPLYVPVLKEGENLSKVEDGTMHDTQLQSAWAAFCQSSSLSIKEKGEHLNKFLCLLFETTPHHVPTINRLSFSKHQVISSYIGSHFLVELENLCQNSSFLAKVKDSSENGQAQFRAPIWSHRPEQGPSSSLELSLRVRPPLTSSSSLPSLQKYADESVEGENQSETSLCVHHSDESLSSAVTLETVSSAKVNRKRPVRTRDAIRLRMRREGGPAFPELRVMGGSSDQGDSDVGACRDEPVAPTQEVEMDEMTKVYSVDQFSCPEDDVEDQVHSSPHPLPQYPSGEEESSDVEGDGETQNSFPLRNEELMEAIREFLTTGRGSRMLMVLDQIGAVGTTVGYEIVKFLGYIFEYFLDELIKNDGSEGNSKRKISQDLLFAETQYHCTISEIKLSDIFKPVLFPKTPSALHPTTRIQAFLGAESRDSPKLGCLPNIPPHKKCNKRLRMRRSSSQMEKGIDSDDDGEKIRKQYIQYKKTLQTCECFHPESLLKRRPEAETPPTACKQRPMYLQLNDLLDVLLSVMIQFALYDPFSNSVDHYSNKCARHILEFSFKMISKLWVDAEDIHKSPTRIQLLKKLSAPLIKMIFSGAQKFVKNSSLFQVFNRLYVSRQLLHFTEMLLKLSKDISNLEKMQTLPSSEVVLNNHDDERYCNHKTKITYDRTQTSWIANDLADIVIGIALILKCVSCERGGVIFTKKEVFPVRSFLTPEYVSIFSEIFILSVDFELEKRFTIVQSFSRLILYLKVWKEDFLHKSKCEKSTHKSCEYSLITSHHVPYFGNGAINTSDDDPNKCLISTLVKFLLSCFKHFLHSDVSLVILQLLSKTGFCSCMSLCLILPYLLDGIESRTVNLQTAITVFIETTVWSELDGSDLINGNRCSDDFTKTPLHSDQGSEVRGHTNVCNSNEHQQNISTKNLTRWGGLRLYFKYLFSPNVGPLITQHLAKLIPISRCYIIEELNQALILPSFEYLIKNEFLIPKCDSASSFDITNNLLKCLRLSHSVFLDASIFKLMEEHGMNIIDHYRKEPNTRFEAFHLLCCAVDQEQKCWQGRISYPSLQEASLLCCDHAFSQYFLNQLAQFEVFWMSIFEESSLQVRSKANIHPLPGRHPFRRRGNSSFESRLNSEELEEVHDISQEESGSEEIHSGDMKDTSTSSTNSKTLGYASLLDSYSSMADLWQLTCEMLSQSDEFLTFIAKSSVCDIVSLFLINIVQDYARASNNLLDEPSVVYKNLYITLSLCRSLLTTMILCFPSGGHELEKPLEEFRHHILRISSSNCEDIRAFTSMLFQCSVLTKNTNRRPDVNSFATVLEPQNLFKGGSEGSSDIDTDGYDADTEFQQPKHVDSSSSIDLDVRPDAGALECPELLVLALDLIISHHEKYLVAKQCSTPSGAAKMPPRTPSSECTGQDVPLKKTAEGYSDRIENGIEDVGEVNKSVEVAKSFVKENATENGVKEDANLAEEEKLSGSNTHTNEVSVVKKDMECLDSQTTVTDCVPQSCGDTKEQTLISSPGCEPNRKEVEPETNKGKGSSTKKKRKGKRKRGKRQVQKELFPSPAVEKLETSPTLLDASDNNSTPSDSKSRSSDSSSGARHFVTSSKFSISEEPPPSPQFDIHFTSTAPLPVKQSPAEKLNTPGVSGNSPTTSSAHETSSTNVPSNVSTLSSFAKPHLCTPTEENHVLVLTQTLNDILLICRRSGSVCLQLQSHAFLQKLIDGFGNIIKENDSSYSELITCIVNIWGEVAQRRLEAPELGQFFGLFKTEHPPVSILLRALCRVFETGSKDPHFALRFPSPPPQPIDIVGDLEQSKSRSLMTSLMSLTSFVEVTAPVSAVVESITTLQNNQNKNNVVSCVSSSCLICPVPRSLDWSLYNDGASVATWISLERRKPTGNVPLTTKGRRMYSCDGLSPKIHMTGSFPFKRGTSTSHPCKDMRTRIHVLSIGSQHLMISVWIEGSTDKIFVTASSEGNSESKLIDEFCLEKVALKNAEWHHLALIIPKINVRRGGIISLTVLLDGSRQFPVQLHIPHIGAIKKSTPPYLLIGQSSSEENDLRKGIEKVLIEGDENSSPSPESASSFSPDQRSPSHFVSMGLVFVFRETVLTVQRCLGLMALGKNASSIVVAAPHPHKTVFVPLINKKLLSSQIDCSFLFKDMRSLLAPLQENLLLQFSPHEPTEYIYYKKSTPVHPEHAGSPYPLCITQKSVVFTPLHPVERNTPELSLLKLGGASNLVFLVARIAELGDSSKNFADSISLLFRLCRQDPIIGLQFSIFSGANLVCRLIRAPQAPSGVLILKALVEACVHPSIIQFEACRNVFCIAAHIPAYVIDRDLLDTILRNWRSFFRDSSECNSQDEYVCVDSFGNALNCIGIILSIIHVLLMDSCPYKEFNFVQLKDISTLTRIIEIFEELKAESLPLENVCSPELIISVVALLLGGRSHGHLFLPWENSSHSSGLETGSSPERPETLRLRDTHLNLGLVKPGLKGSELMELGHFLLNLHPDELTYVTTDSQHAFYLFHYANQSARASQASGSGFDSGSPVNENKALHSKFSQFSLRGNVPLSAYDSSPDHSFEASPIEEGEEAITSNATCGSEENIDPVIVSGGETFLSVMSDVGDGTQRDKVSESSNSYNKTTGENSASNGELRDITNRKECFSSEKMDRKGSKQRSVSEHHLVRERKIAEERLSSVLRRSSSEHRVCPDGSDGFNPVRDPSENEDLSVEPKHDDISPDPSPEREMHADKMSFSSKPKPTDVDSQINPNGKDDSSGKSNVTSNLSLMIVGFLNVIEETLRSLSETQSSVVINEMFSIDLVVLLANSPVAAVRSAALGLFRTMLLRGCKEYLSFHLKRHIVHLMALQLHKHSPSSEALVAEAFALALKFDLKLDDVTIEDVVLNPSHKITLFVPLFAILPSCSSDLALCHNTLTTFLHILRMNEDLLVKIYLKTHFVNSVLLTMRNVLHEDANSAGDFSSSCDPRTIVEDVIEILRFLIHHLIALDGNAPFTTCREVLCIVNLLYRRECNKCGPFADCTNAFQEVEGALLEGALIKLREESANVGQRQSHYVMFSPDSTSSTNSDADDLKSFSRSKNFEGFRKFTNFFQRSSFNKDSSGRNSASTGWMKRPTTGFANPVNQGSASPIEMSPAMQRLSLNNIGESYKITLQLCIQFIILIAQHRRELRPPQSKFAMSLLDIMCSSVKTVSQYEGSGKSNLAQGVEYLALNCGNIVENFWVLLTHLISPRMSFETRVETLSLIASQSEIKMIFSYCIRIDMPLLYRFGIFVHDLRYKFSDITEATINEVDMILESLKQCGLTILPPPEEKVAEWSVVKEEKRKWSEDMASVATAIQRQNAMQEAKFLAKPKLTLMHDQVCAEGTRMSWQLLETQNERLKAALKRVKDAQCKRIKYTYCWRDIVDLLTHEKAPWFFPEAFPRGWKLDGTEGPLRIRKRLTRCRLNVDSKFFLPYCTERHNKRGPPLQTLLVEKEIESALGHIVESISEDENLIHTCHASFVAPTVEQKGEFLISHKHLYFIGEETPPKNAMDTPTVISKLWTMDVVREVHLRRYRLKDCAIELFSTNGQSALLAFPTEKERNEVMSILSTLHFPNLKRESSLGEYMSLWREGLITNFEYLTQLNKLAGRSFNDLMQYPVFPFVLGQYSTKFLNLEDSSIYRNLKKPVPIQKEEKEEHFRNNYETSKQMCEDGPYHYGSHYSNSGIVLYYLIRLPPYTQLFLDFQDGNFDVPDRSFHSLETTWRLAASDSTTAIRELIPEFFFLPELFSNTQGFRFGIRQNGDIVNHVELPQWCQGDPRKFVLVHRAMLESAYVTQHLQHWIDLVFGFKQTGKAAVEAINVFHPATYFGFDVEINSDELAIEARRTMIRTYGQTPRQLLTHPHPAPSLSTFPHIKAPPSHKQDIPPVLSEVSGIPWGIYAGSPADPKPSVQLVQGLQTNIRSLFSVSPNEVMLLAPNTVIHTVKARKADILSLHRYVISWNHNDGIVRCKRHTASVVYPLISLPLYNKVTYCVMSQKQLWLGTESGQVLVYLVSSLHGKGELIANTPNHPLLAHTAAISCLLISHDFKVCFSGGKDGTVVLWDTNRLSYIRSVTVSEDHINLLGVSETMGDWVSVTNSSSGESSILRYYTINAEIIDSVSIDARVTCVAFSNCPEGRNVNVIAVGSSDRSIRLLSTWDLALVRVLCSDRVKETPISLLYTENNYHLCVITEGQVLVVWETSLAKCKLPKFISVGAI